jgi:hypothetical protein
MEIYNEEINDLLTIEGQKLRIHESLEVSTHLDIFFSDFWTGFCNNENLLLPIAWSVCGRFAGGDCEQRRASA